MAMWWDGERRWAWMCCGSGTLYSHLLIAPRVVVDVGKDGWRVCVNGACAIVTCFNFHVCDLSPMLSPAVGQVSHSGMLGHTAARCVRVRSVLFCS